jgi:hypothetical protein
MKWTRNGTGNGWELGLAVLALGVVALTPQIRADDASQGAARLSSVDGQVRISQGGQVLADPALVNTPLFAGTQIETGDDGKAEIQFDDGSIARLSPGSAMTLVNIGNNGVTDMVMEGGLAYFELQGNGPGGDTRVTFGDAAVSAAGFTVMRIKMDNPPGELAVFSGNAHLQRSNALSLDLRGGESITLGAGDPSRYNLAQNIEPDSWDDWNSDRDQALNAMASDQTEAASSITNNEAPNPQWNDLDANGNWYNVPGQGYVWSPYEASAAGWDPYGCGHWVWTPGYGYIWVSCESWGYLPYASGSWSYYDGFGWGWMPGTGRTWWRGGGYRGINIVRPPRGYRPVELPMARKPEGRTTPRPVSINRGGFDRGGSNGGGEGLPVRSRNSPVEIGGHTVQPLRPTPTHRYEPSQSGFVYRPSQGGRSSTYGGNANPRNGSQGTGNAGPVNSGTGNSGTSNHGSGFTGSRPSGPASGAVNGARGGYNNNGAGNNGSGNGASGGSGNTGRRDSYTPDSAPRYVAIPTSPSATHNELPGNNRAPGGNNGTPNSIVPPTSGNPASGGAVPRDSYRARPDGGAGNVAVPYPNRPVNGGSSFGGQSIVRPSNNGGNTTQPNSGGSTLTRPANSGGGQPSPRPSSGGAPSGGGGSSAPRPSGGGGGSAPRPAGGGGAPHSSGDGPHGSRVH